MANESQSQLAFSKWPFVFGDLEWRCFHDNVTNVFPRKDQRSSILWQISVQGFMHVPAGRRGVTTQKIGRSDGGPSGVRVADRESIRAAETDPHTNACRDKSRLGCRPCTRPLYRRNL